MNMPALIPETTVNEMFFLYEKYGKKHSKGQPISPLEQVSQAAALAEEEGYEDEVILAAFFHNIGSICTDTEHGNNHSPMASFDQEKLGANYLRELGFSERLATLVESDLQATRYLAYKYPEYYERLSDDEKTQLSIRGGRMSRQEAANFELDPDAEIFVRLRYLNDKAKEVRKPILNISHIKLLAMSHLYKIMDRYAPAFLVPKPIIQP